MVILLLAILAAVAIPNFQDFRTESRDAAVQASLGGVRAAIAVARATIALKEDTGVPLYPTFVEMQLNAYNGSHPIMNALASQNKKIMDGSAGFPVNAWSLITIPLNQQASVFDCSYTAKPNVRSTGGQLNFGWCYNHTSGEFWSNSVRNGGSAGNTENYF